MKKKRSIDRQREAAITMRIGDDEDKSPIKDFLSTENALFTIKEKGVYKVQLADDIDPKRTNPHIPNVSQKVLPAGDTNEVVGRVLLTAKCLFDEKNSTVKPFVGSLLEQSIELTRHILELNEMIEDLKRIIIEKGTEFEKREHKSNAYTLPSIPSLDKDIHNILVKADKAKDSIYSLYRLYFLPTSAKPELNKYDPAIRDKLSEQPEILEGWCETKTILNLIRNIRNASEHRKEGQQVKLKDFEMQSDGSVMSPTIEIEHKDTPIKPTGVLEFLNYIKDLVLNHAEGSIVTIKCATLLDKNPLKESVGYAPPESRKHQFIRYYRTIDFKGEVRILG